MCAHDLEGIVAKRLTDAYSPRVRWLKIKNPGYSQNGGRRELFDSSSRAAGGLAMTNGVASGLGSMPLRRAGLTAG
jgi:hypothetical protein